MQGTRWTTLLLGAGLCACTPLRMAVPGDLAAGAHLYEVQNRSSWKGALVDESFQFGPYRVTKVDRDWSSTSGWGVGAFSTSALKTGYAYALVTPAGELAGRCGVEDEKTGVALLGGQLSSQRTSLACACGADNNGARFVLKGENGAPLAGAAVVAEANLAVRPIDRDETGHLQRDGLGWELRGAGGIGAVEVAHPGRIWLDKGLAPATAQEVACLLAGLLLYDPPARQP